MNKYDKVFVVDVSFGNRTRFLFDEWKEVDVSALARKANPGGGGHKAAAGFQLSVEDMMGFLKERRM